MNWRHPTTIVGAVMLAIVIAAAVLAPLLARHEPLAQPYRSAALAPPSLGHWLGIDDAGRDVTTRLLYGARTTLLISLGATLLAVGGGALLGAVAGTRGGLLDVLISHTADFLLAFPPVLLGLVVLSVLRPSAGSVTLAVGIAGLPPVIRQVRAAYVAEHLKDYVAAARAAGAGRWRIATREVLPNCTRLIGVLLALSLGSAVLEAAGLSFLGLAGQPDVPEWGMMLREQWRTVRIAPWLCLAPGLAIAWTVLGFNLLGDGLRSAARSTPHHPTTG
jgi:ABC-type dipeptide/oligopeptide/nickel transport system permease subunit